MQKYENEHFAATQCRTGVRGEGWLRKGIEKGDRRGDLRKWTGNLRKWTGGVRKGTVGLRKGTGDVRKGTGGVKKGSTFNLAGEF